MLPKYMSGVQLTRHGGPEALVWRDDIPVPRPGPGQILVRVLAAGVNNTDINTRIGWYSADVTDATGAVDDGAGTESGGWSGALVFPRIQGGDVCGEVIEIGPDVTGIALGGRVTSQINLPRPTEADKYRCIVLGSEADGAFAQYCRLEASEIFDVSASPLSDIEIAAMPCAYGTAFNLLHRAGVASGQRVLVTGASGGVGMAAVQLASLRGAEVTGVAALAKAQAVRDAGAAQVLSRDEVPQRDGYHAVIDVVGGAMFAGLIRAVRPGGHYAVAGAIAGPLVQADLREIYLRDITIHGCTFQPRAVFAELVALINAGRVRPLVSKTYPLRDIAAAQEDFMSKRYPGKLVLVPPGGRAMSAETYLLYLGVLAVFFATPPDTSQLLIVSNSLRHGLRRSLATVAGDLSANTAQMTAAAFGLTALVATSADALWAVKWAGVAYLAWIGLTLMLSRARAPEPKAAARGRLFRQGFLTSMANPYAVVFFGALFPQFIDTSAPVLPQLAILGATYLAVDGAILVLWGWAAQRTVGRIRGLTGHWINRISGALMIAAAALLGAKDLERAR